jgi:hypothetical protein
VEASALQEGVFWSVRLQKISDERRPEREDRSEVRSEKIRSEADQRRWASQVASSGRRYFGVIVLVELSNKQLHLPEPIHLLSWNPGYMTI